MWRWNKVNNQTSTQDRGNIFTLVVAVLGLVKIIAGLFGYNLGIDDADINEIANYVAIIAAFGGVVLNNHLKSKSFKKVK
jgi:uncharacterized membrane protein